MNSIKQLKIIIVLIFTISSNSGHSIHFNDMLRNINDLLNNISVYKDKDDTYKELYKINAIKENKEFDVDTQNSKYLLLVNKDASKEVERRFEDVKKYKEEKKKAKLVHEQHDRKVNEINEFMENNYLTTNYLYNEMKRIKTQREVKDDLRRMVEYLEKPGNELLKASVLNCYRTARREEKIPYNRWKQNTNNLVINVIKDPDSDGYIN